MPTVDFIFSIVCRDGDDERRPNKRMHIWITIYKQKSKFYVFNKNIYENNFTALIPNNNNNKLYKILFSYSAFKAFFSFHKALGCVYIPVIPLYMPYTCLRFIWGIFKIFIFYLCTMYKSHFFFFYSLGTKLNSLQIYFHWKKAICIYIINGIHFSFALYFMKITHPFTLKNEIKKLCITYPCTNIMRSCSYILCKYFHMYKIFKFLEWMST